MTDFLAGVTAMASFVAAAFFLRFWTGSRDRLFLIFGIAFAVFGVNRILLTLLEEGNEASTWIYLSRLLAFVMIIVAILDKNVRRT